MSTIVATGTVTFDAGSSQEQLVAVATPQGGGSAINMGTISSPGTFTLSAAVPSGVVYDIAVTASDLNTVTQGGSVAA